MKILFIQPPYPFSEFPKPSYALMSMGAVLKEQGMDVEVLDLLSTRYSPEKNRGLPGPLPAGPDRGHQRDHEFPRRRPDSSDLQDPDAGRRCRDRRPACHLHGRGDPPLLSRSGHRGARRGRGDDPGGGEGPGTKGRPGGGHGADLPRQRDRRPDGRSSFYRRYRPLAPPRPDPFPHFPLPGHACSGQRSHQPRLPDGMFVLRRVPHDRPQRAVPQSPAGGGRNRGGAAARVRGGVHRRRSFHPQPAACDRHLRRDPEPRAEVEAVHLRPGRHGRRTPSSASSRRPAAP